MGKLIVFEGGDGSGKTTQLQQTHDWLLNYLGKNTPIVVTREPGATDLGAKLRQLLLEGSPPCNQAELLLYAADRAQHVDEILKPQLEKGAIVLCDRYTDSTVAYQGFGRGTNLSLIRQLNQISTSGLESDLTLWFDVDVEIGLSRVRERGNTDRIEQADLAFHQRVHQAYAALATASPRFIRIDANKTIEEVQRQIQQTLLDRRMFAKLSN